MAALSGEEAEGGEGTISSLRGEGERKGTRLGEIVGRRGVVSVMGEEDDVSKREGRDEAVD